jgi:hypothetical protein
LDKKLNYITGDINENEIEEMRRSDIIRKSSKTEIESNYLSGS